MAGQMNRCDRLGCNNTVERDGDMCTDCRRGIVESMARQLVSSGMTEEHGGGKCQPGCPICMEAD